MNYLEFLQTLKKDLIRSNIEFETVKFFRKDIVSVWIGSLATERPLQLNNRMRQS